MGRFPFTWTARDINSNSLPVALTLSVNSSSVIVSSLCITRISLQEEAAARDVSVRFLQQNPTASKRPRRYQCVPKQQLVAASVALTDLLLRLATQQNTDSHRDARTLAKCALEPRKPCRPRVTRRPALRAPSVPHPHTPHRIQIQLLLQIPQHLVRNRTLISEPHQHPTLGLPHAAPQLVP